MEGFWVPCSCATPLRSLEQVWKFQAFVVNGWLVYVNTSHDCKTCLA